MREEENKREEKGKEREGACERGVWFEQAGVGVWSVCVSVCVWSVGRSRQQVARAEQLHCPVLPLLQLVGAGVTHVAVGIALRSERACCCLACVRACVRA